MSRNPYAPPKAFVDLPRRRSVAEIEGFITMLRAACDDAKMNASLQKLLAMPDLERRTLVRSWVAELLTKEAPPDFIEAIACLYDDAIAERAYEVIFKCSR
ncbi:MAG TPA: hypothetical protein VGI18_08125 [Burkholderiales bacterium]|jgi:hypothetical protein